MNLRNFSFLILSLLLIFPSCGKYEEGPGLSLRSKKARVANVWIVDSAQDLADGVDITADYAGEQFEFTKDGAYLENGVNAGSWEFDSNKERIIITSLDASTDTYTIIQLKENSMILEIPGEERISYIPLN